MKRITKATHKAFIDALATECAAAGIEKSAEGDVHRLGMECYEAITRAGRYWFRPALPYGEPRRVYDITVFGRFEDEKAAAKLVDCNPHSGKWNWHGGYMDGAQAREYATHIITRILSV